jgi:hypothetical protein
MRLPDMNYRLGGIGASVRFGAINLDQFSSLDVDPVGRASKTTLRGVVLNSAGAATLTYDGNAGGVVSSTATFLVTGSSGEASVAVTEGESLSAVAKRVNRLAAKTGVSAVVKGDQLIFQNAGVGSNSTVSVRLESYGKNTSTSGVNSSQISQFKILNMAGNVSLEFTQGFQGRFDAVELSRGRDKTAPTTQLTFLPSSTDGSRVLSMAGLDSFSLGGRKGKLNQLDLGGDASVLDGKTKAALTITNQALERLDVIDRIADVSSAVAHGGLNSSIVSEAIAYRSAIRNQVLSRALEKANFFQVDQPSVFDVVV